MQYSRHGAYCRETEIAGTEVGRSQQADAISSTTAAHNHPAIMLQPTLSPPTVTRHRTARVRATTSPKRASLIDCSQPSLSPTRVRKEPKVIVIQTSHPSKWSCSVQM